MSAQRTLSQLVKVSEARLTEVNLKDDFVNPTRNREKLTGYIPNESSRRALRGILAGLYPPAEQRAHVLTGSFGTGKSHLALVVANLARRDTEEADFGPLREKLRQADEELEKQLHTLRGGAKPYLVVLPDWWDHGFKVGLLRGLREALPEGIAAPRTYFDTARERLADWQAHHPEVWSRLNSALGEEGYDPRMLEAGLEDYNPHFYDLFRRLHPRVLYGAEFAPEESADPCKAYEQAAKDLQATGQWAGIPDGPRATFHRSTGGAAVRGVLQTQRRRGLSPPAHLPYQSGNVPSECRGWRRVAEGRRPLQGVSPLRRQSTA
jgi:hypothetical protein